MPHMSPQIIGVCRLGSMLPAQSWKHTQSGSSLHMVSWSQHMFFTHVSQSVSSGVAAHGSAGAPVVVSPLDPVSGDTLSELPPSELSAGPVSVPVSLVVVVIDEVALVDIVVAESAVVTVIDVVVPESEPEVSVPLVPPVPPSSPAQAASEDEINNDESQVDGRRCKRMARAYHRRRLLGVLVAARSWWWFR